MTPASRGKEVILGAQRRFTQTACQSLDAEDAEDAEESFDTEDTEDTEEKFNN